MKNGEVNIFDETKVPTMKIYQRFLLKKTTYICNFFQGYALIAYENEKVAQETFKRMLGAGKKVELKGKVLKEYWKGKSAYDIMNLYIDDVKKGMEKNSRMASISYELL